MTQDIGVADIDQDGDSDLVLGNEDDNEVLINDGDGRFTDETAPRLPLRDGPEETRNVDFAHGDGDLDFANVHISTSDADAQDRLLLNDGRGHSTDKTTGPPPVRGREHDDRDLPRR